MLPDKHCNSSLPELGHGNFLCLEAKLCWREISRDFFLGETNSKQFWEIFPRLKGRSLKKLWPNFLKVARNRFLSGHSVAKDVYLYFRKVAE